LRAVERASGVLDEEVLGRVVRAKEGAELLLRGAVELPGDVFEDTARERVLAHGDSLAVARQQMRAEKSRERRLAGAEVALEQLERLPRDLGMRCPVRAEVGQVRIDDEL